MARSKVRRLEFGLSLSRLLPSACPAMESPEARASDSKREMALSLFPRPPLFLSLLLLRVCWFFLPFLLLAFPSNERARTALSLPRSAPSDRLLRMRI